MRSIWKGAISFGLVMIPVKLYSATEQRDVSFHQVHRKDAGRIKYRRVCSVCGEEVSYGDIAKGFELPTGETVVLEDEDFARLPLTTSRRIDVLQFSPLEQVDPIYFAKSYYLEPEAVGVKPYVLLRDALENSGQVAIVKVALRQREALATLRVREGVFVLETMLWPDEVRTAAFGFLQEPVDVRSQELKMAESLIDSMAADFDPAEYKDAYREALEQVIEAKVEGKEIVGPTPEGAEAGAGADLMATLRASVEAAKRERAAAGKGEGKAEKKAAGGSPARGGPRKKASGEPDSAKAEGEPRRRRTRKTA
ncbi:Ku protein [Rhizohabitans arisaemae]|uniref:non-homologous end joining protein Ku n=1 Tax=Rhizohabitans arisaemae TaxID=2720610 RepID=UPI0024B0EAC3|nr:Ku protein [Rhizohabitans arisaemae]